MRNDNKMVVLDDDTLENVVGGCIGCILESDYCTGKGGKSFGSLLQTFGKMLVKWTK